MGNKVEIYTTLFQLFVLFQNVFQNCRVCYVVFSKIGEGHGLLLNIVITYQPGCDITYITHCSIMALGCSFGSLYSLLQQHAFGMSL